MRVNENNQRDGVKHQGFHKVIYRQNHAGESSPSLYFCLTFQRQNWIFKSLENEKQGLIGLASCKSTHLRFERSAKLFPQ
jgi:hypothetical protein